MNIKILIILSFFLLLSCSKTTNIKENTSKYDNNTKKDYELFDSANKFIKKENYNEAINELEKIEIFFPNSSYSAKSKLITSYLHFIQEDYEKTKAITENFIKYYPGNKDIIYAYYLDGMTDYVQINKPEYNQKNTIIAKNKFLFIKNAYPNNIYKQDIILKLNILDNSLANHLINIGKYYEKKENYEAALNYYLDIFNKYEKTQFIEEAIYRIVTIYAKIDEKENAKKYASILGYNYPNNKWYKKSYNLLKNITPEIKNDKKWYEKLTTIKLLIQNKITKEKEWFEPIKPNFKLL